MKIQQKCDEKPTSLDMTHAKVPVGTVYKYGDISQGPYLRVVEGFVDLKENHSYLNTSFGSYILTNYTVLPNAKVVLE